MEGLHGAGSINLRPNSYEGKWDYLMVSTWLYKVEQYLTLVQLTIPETAITENNKVVFVSTFLSGTAAIWWYTFVQGNHASGTWNELKTAVLAEFVLDDHVRRTRERLMSLKQVTSVSKYISDYRNMILTIPDITEGEKFDRFFARLKFNVRLEVMKSTVGTFEEAAKIALCIDSALWSTNCSPFGFGGGAAAVGPAPMEIGNVEGARVPRRRFSNGQPMNGQRMFDMRNNACFECHKVGCRPWKHCEVVVNHAEALPFEGDAEGF